MKKIFTAIVALAALVSCNQENINDNTSVESTSRFPLLKVDNGLTKTTLDGTQVKFEVGDCISVFNGIVSETNHHGHCKYQCISVEGGVATFEWMAGMDESKNVPFNQYEPAGDVEIVATYPNRSADTSAFEPSGEDYGEGTVKIRMPATGTASGTDSFVSTSLPIIACAPQGQMLKFKHTCGLLELTMKGTATIKKVQMASEKVISGNASVQYEVAEPVLTVVGTGDTSKDKLITYTYSDGAALTEAGTKLYFGLPVGTHDLTFTFTDTDGNSMVKKAEGLKIERAVVTPSELTYAPAVAEVTDLSANGSYANCYVVQEAGSYSFDAKKPNGDVVTGESAAWVWASGEKIDSEGKQVGSACALAEMISNINLKNGKITFTVPENFVVGNVVLGVVDANNDLVWTWHLWLTTGLSDVTADGVTIMDRNLGAAYKFDVTTADNAAQLLLAKGNFYQWGRKDPILGPRNNTDESSAFGSSQKCLINTEAGINNVTAWGIGGDFGGLTPEHGVKYPLTMAAAGKVPGEDDSETAWSARPNANPCPYGYRIINKSEFNTLIAKGMTSENYSDTNYAQMKLAGSVVFPRLGRRPGSSGKAGKASSSNSVGIYWYDDVRATGYRFYWTNNTTVNTSNTAEYADWATTGACNSVSVRCVKVTK